MAASSGYGPSPRMRLIFDGDEKKYELIHETRPTITAVTTIV